MSNPFILTPFYKLKEPLFRTTFEADIGPLIKI